MSTFFQKVIRCDADGCEAKILATGDAHGWWSSPMCKCAKETRAHLCPDHNPNKEDDQ